MSDTASPSTSSPSTSAPSTSAPSTSAPRAAAPSQPADQPDDAARALQAVQVALDRRDNGGNAAPARDSK